MNCGTEKGLKSHQNRNEPPCRFCIKFRDDPAPAPVIECGTVNGRNKHRRDGEPVCDPCRLAYNAYQRRNYKPRTRTTTGEIVHGTVWGYQQHKSRGDADCEPCRLAANAKRKALRAEQRDKGKEAA